MRSPQYALAFHSPTCTFPLRTAYRQLHKIIFVSRLAQNLWLDVNAWMPKERCVVVHNSTLESTEAKAQTDIRRHLCIDKDTSLLMSTGRVRRSKGCATMKTVLLLSQITPNNLLPL